MDLRVKYIVDRMPSTFKLITRLQGCNPKIASYTEIYLKLSLKSIVSVDKNISEEVHIVL